ncbi:bacteriocin family protein [Microaerobacter geothermalis]|uniref:family 1 encapsulin nanocompartment shell protein n=1 Tax=Microaerobacter geothermalis TaxID=674972 RepID=UPI001F4161B0|nr:family 1 encapsulin nanocompartment shell protein [Microaerobacter geothermalis]MCF6094116.1 bacteriocin family protein [Microaerobacter geothermalis]
MSKTHIYGDSPLSEKDWHRLDETVVDMAKKQLVGRRFIPIYGPLGQGIQSVAVDIYDEQTGGSLDLRGESSKITNPTRRIHLTIPLIYKDFILYWRDLEQAKTLHLPIDLSAAANAAAQCSLLEDSLIFHGSDDFGLPGLMNVNGRLTHIRGDWMESGNAFQDVVDARNKLLQHGHTGPYAMVVSPELYSLLHRVHKGTNVLEIEHVRELITEGVYQSPVLKAGTGVIMSTGSHNMDLAIAEDMDTAYLDHENMNHVFRVYEALVLRIKRPTSICTLEPLEG